MILYDVLSNLRSESPGFVATMKGRRCEDDEGLDKEFWAFLRTLIKPEIWTDPCLKGTFLLQIMDRCSPPWTGGRVRMWPFILGDTHYFVTALVICRHICKQYFTNGREKMWVDSPWGNEAVWFFVVFFYCFFKKLLVYGLNIWNIS